MPIDIDGVAGAAVLGNGNRSVAPGRRTGVVLIGTAEDDPVGQASLDRGGIVGLGEELVVALLPAVVPGAADFLEVDAFGGFGDDGELDGPVPAEVVVVVSITAVVDRV